MRVISLVPSLTETLIECGVNVVGRTRFCIHPSESVQRIEVVGGTKGINWTKCQALQPDILVLDKEENLAKMAEQSPYPWVATHLQSVDDAPKEFTRLAQELESTALIAHAQRWQDVLALPAREGVDWESVPGQITALINHHGDYQRIEYIIWQDPWMSVAKNTFIGSVLQRLGFAKFMPEHSQKYPQLESKQMARDDTFYLFSSEPYRFARKADQLKRAGFNGAIVDGELYSWFGVRSLRGLTQYLR